MCGILCILNKYKLNCSIFLNELSKLQHRGQDSFGFSFINNNKITNNNIKGRIKNYKIENDLESDIFIGHTRYITSGAKNNPIYQPIIGNSKFGDFVFVFNGNIPLDKDKDNDKIDTILIKNYLVNKSQNYESFEELLINFVNKYERAYSMIIYNNQNIYILKDRFAVRPLSYINKESKIIISSELPYDANELLGGEIIRFKNYNIDYIYKHNSKINASCLFEYIYFMNKDTIWNKINVKTIRESYGALLAENEQIIFDKNYIVIGIPNSGIPSAIEYAKQMNLEYKQYIQKNKNINRTFILKNNKERSDMSNKKYIFDKNLIDKKIIIIDDSIVRGITIKTLIKNLKNFGVKEIHIRIAAPQIKFTCQYGIDIPKKEDLLVNKYNSLEEIRLNLECNSINYLDINKIKNIMPNYNKLCTGCFNNNYKNLEW